jgi:tRNA pseudouridine55 synthase
VKASCSPGLASEAGGRQRGVSGVLVVDKPRGPTSHDVVARLRKALGTREVGHAGTLDPMATGVLVALVGEATKLAPFLTADDKEYEATVELGTETDTLDADGKVARRLAVPAETVAALSGTGEPLHAILGRALDAERARSEQVPPAFSAIHAGGERAHARARRGEKVELAARPVHVNRIDVLGAGLDPAPWLTLSLSVGKGYFVRSLARDLAATLGTVGHLSALRRTRSGSFTLEEAILLDTPADEMAARLLPTGLAAARALPVARLTDVGARDARVGRPVRSGDVDARGVGVFAWLDAKGVLVAVGEVAADGAGKVVRGFRDAGGDG